MKIRDLELTDKSAVQFVIKDAFSGFPWYLDHPQPELEDIWRGAIAKPGFTGLVATNDEGVIVGVSWWYLPPPDSIHGNKLSRFILSTRVDRVLVWEDAILVCQKYQRQGIGTALRRAFVERTRKIFNRVIILSRMRSDNIPSLLLAERLGFNRTGARSKEGDNPPVFQEFWYLLL